MVIVVMPILNENRCFALGDVTNNSTWTDWEPSVIGSEKFEDKVGSILNVIQLLGIIISVITLSIIGIKFMLGSVEEKANYKQTMMPWLIGAVMIFSVTTLPSAIYEMVQSADDPTNEGKWEFDIAGRDEAINDAEATYNNFKVMYANNNSRMWENFSAWVKTETVTGQNEYYTKGYEYGMEKINRIIEKYGPDELKVKSFFDGYNSAKSDIEDGTINQENIQDEMNDIFPTSNAYQEGRHWRLKWENNKYKGVGWIGN